MDLIGTAEEGGGGGYNDENMKKAKLNSKLTALVNDPLMSDIPKNPTLSDVDTLISLELGSAMRLSILKLDCSAFDVVVMNSATVKDLKLAIKKKVNECEQSQMGHRQISWKHVWRNYCLSHQGEKLIDDSKKLQDFGLRNISQVDFIQFITARLTRKHTRRRKHRFFHGLSKVLN